MPTIRRESSECSPYGSLGVPPTPFIPGLKEKVVSTLFFINMMIDFFLSIRALDALAIGAGSWLLFRIYQIARARARTTKLPGPTHRSWLFGVTKDVFKGDSGSLYEAWAQTYGTVFQVPGPLGSRQTVLIDPKGIASVFARINTYTKNDLAKTFIEDLVSSGYTSYSSLS